MVHTIITFILYAFTISSLLWQNASYTPRSSIPSRLCEKRTTPSIYKTNGKATHFLGKKVVRESILSFQFVSKLLLKSCNNYTILLSLRACPFPPFSAQGSYFFSNKLYVSHDLHKERLRAKLMCETLLNDEIYVTEKGYIRYLYNLWRVGKQKEQRKFQNIPINTITKIPMIEGEQGERALLIENHLPLTFSNQGGLRVLCHVFYLLSRMILFILFRTCTTLQYCNTNY